MAVISSEIKWFRSALTSPTVAAQNGGRFSETQSVSGVKNNLLPDVTVAQRTAGVEQYAKAFIGIRNASNLGVIDPKISLESGTPGDSYILLHPGTQTDTQATLSARPYGYGTLASSVSAAATSITVTAESAAYASMSAKPFQAGDTIRIDARATVADSGNYEYAEISTISYSGATMTIGLVSGLTNGYAAGVHVASVIEPGDIAASYTGKSVTGGVTYDDTTYPIAVPAIGGVYQVFTVTVTNAATGALSVSGDTLGSLGTGAQGSNLAPTNPNGGVYFTLAADGWGGTAANGDTLVFTTVPCATPIWYHRVVPAGSDAISDDSVVACIDCESA